jgi:hypothetical protein
VKYLQLVKANYDGKDKTLNIIASGDWHTGHINYREDIVKSEFIDKLDYNTRGLLLGDLMECATKQSIGAGLFDTNMTPQRQKEYVLELLRPKAEFIDAAVIGNHEYRIYKDTSIDLMQDICKELNIPYLLFNGCVKYAWNGCAYTVNIWHGAGSGGTTQSAINCCEKMALRTFADVYCCGHFHKKLKSDRVINVPDVRNNKIVDVTQQFVVSGSALGYSDGYAEQAGLQARDLGFPIIQLQGIKGNKDAKVIA